MNLRIPLGCAVAIALLPLASIFPFTPARGQDPLEAASGGIACERCPSVASACEEPDVWVASTRHLPRVCLPQSDADFRIERRDAPGRWGPASLEELSGTEGPVVFFIHGNRYDACAAKRQGVALGRRLARCREEAGPIRTVILSWPSESVGPPLREARDNAVRAESDGHYFGALLARFSAASSIGIVGYSFGSKIALIGLEDVQAIAPQWHADRAGRLGLVLVTPAVRVDSLAPGRRHHEAMAAADRITLFTNSHDEALRFFPLLDRSGVDAAGYVGIPRRWVPAGVAFAQIDASSIVGKEHSMQRFIDSWPLACHIAADAIE